MAVFRERKKERKVFDVFNIFKNSTLLDVGYSDMYGTGKIFPFAI